MKYIKRFSKVSDYEVFKGGGEYITPNISLIDDGKLVCIENKVSNEITFYLKDAQGDLHQFNAPYSMTWGEFVASEYNTVNELGDKSFKDVGIIQYGDVYRDLTPDGWDYYTEYREVFKNDVALENYVFPDEYIREDVNYIT